MFIKEGGYFSYFKKPKLKNRELQNRKMQGLPLVPFEVKVALDSFW